jgi:hypothetical protein
MLRESCKTENRQVDLSRVTRGFDEATPVPQAALLAEFAEAVVLRDEARTAAARRRIRAELGDAAFVDAAAVAAAFHGFVRIADAIGIPYTTAARGQDAPEVREQAGVNDFYRVRGEA